MEITLTLVEPLTRQENKTLKAIKSGGVVKFLGRKYRAIYIESSLGDSFKISYIISFAVVSHPPST